MIDKYKKYNWVCRDVFFINMWIYNKRLNFMNHSIDQTDNIPKAELIEVINCLKKCGDNNDHEAVEILIDYYEFIRELDELQHWLEKQRNLPPIKWPES
jgi:hypothetical protein